MVDLRDLDLRGRNLSNLDLRHTNLRAADLRNCVFNKTALNNADLSGSDLQGADLSGALGLEAWQFRGTDTREAVLTKEIALWKGLDVIDKAGPALSQQFLVLLAACFYCWLSIASTTDAALILGAATISLPIVQTPISIVLFYSVAPFLVFIAFFYFVLSLHMLWEALAKLPAVFPDGRRLDERAYPWPLIQKVRKHYRLLESRGDFGLQTRFVISLGSLIAYATVPITITIFWLRSLVKHSAILTGWIEILTFLSVLIATQFHHWAVDTLKGFIPFEIDSWKAMFYVEAMKYWVPALTGTALVLVIGSWQGVRTMPAYLFEAELSSKPAGWTEGSDLKAVIGARLRDADLRHAQLQYSFLAKADLSTADLRDADLHMADLREANLVDANLEGADLAFADLRGAELAAAGGLTAEQLQHARMDQTTLLPSKLEYLLPKPEK